MVVPRDQVPSDDEPGPFPAWNALLVVEITSKGGADTDRKTKLWSCAHAGVPLYLLIDRFAEGGPVVELHSVPDNGVFVDSHRLGFGKPVHLPAPFGLELATAEF